MSVPTPGKLMRERVPPKYVVYNLQIGRPMPGPANGVVSEKTDSSSFGVVENMYDQIWLLCSTGTPPPSSLILIPTRHGSSHTRTLMSLGDSFVSTARTNTAHMAFFS